MVSDSVLARRLRDLLRVSDLTMTTTATVRRRLEQDFGVDLSGKRAFIREQIDLFLQSHFDGGGGEEGRGVEHGGGVKGGEGEEEERGDESGGDGGAGEDEVVVDGEEEDNGATNGGGSSSSRMEVPSKTSKDIKRRDGGFTKLCCLSPQLQKFVGVSELARTEVVKELWAYIRYHKLQDPANKRKIICDSRLHELFNVKTIDMFQMNKALSTHIWPLSLECGTTKLSEKEKQHKKERGSDESQQKEKRHKSGSSGFLPPLQLSDALINFFGTGESAVSWADAVKRMWEYIKQNNLQVHISVIWDPSDKRRIICDEKLKDLFEVDSFNGFTVSKLLAAHVIKTG